MGVVEMTDTTACTLNTDKEHRYATACAKIIVNKVLPDLQAAAISGDNGNVMRILRISRQLTMEGLIGEDPDGSLSSTCSLTHPPGCPTFIREGSQGWAVSPDPS